MSFVTAASSHRIAKKATTPSAMPTATVRYAALCNPVFSFRLQSPVAATTPKHANVSSAAIGWRWIRTLGDTTNASAPATNNTRYVATAIVRGLRLDTATSRCSATSPPLRGFR